VELYQKLLAKEEEMYRKLKAREEFFLAELAAKDKQIRTLSRKQKKAPSQATKGGSTSRKSQKPR